MHRKSSQKPRTPLGGPVWGPSSWLAHSPSPSDNAVDSSADRSPMSGIRIRSLVFPFAIRHPLGEWRTDECFLLLDNIHPPIHSSFIIHPFIIHTVYLRDGALENIHPWEWWFQWEQWNYIVVILLFVYLQYILNTRLLNHWNNIVSMGDAFLTNAWRMKFIQWC